MFIREALFEGTDRGLRIEGVIDDLKRVESTDPVVINLKQKLVRTDQVLEEIGQPLQAVLEEGRSRRAQGKSSLGLLPRRLCLLAREVIIEFAAAKYRDHLAASYIRSTRRQIRGLERQFR